MKEPAESLPNLNSVLNDGSKKIKLTNSVTTEAEAMEKKQKLLNSKIFGLFSPVNYQLLSARKVYVPYELLIFSYEVNRKEKNTDGNKKSFFYRSGKIGIVYDLNERHAFHFDLSEEIEWAIKDIDELDGEILPDICTREEIQESCLHTIRWKVLNRTYRNVSDISLTERHKFYRPACEMKFECREKEFIKYAYLDAYGSENEHISGLKVRLQS